MLVSRILKVLVCVAGVIHVSFHELGRDTGRFSGGCDRYCSVVFRVLVIETGVSLV